MKLPFRIGKQVSVMLLMFSLVLGLTLSGAQADQLRLVGSGATFPYPIYSTWFKTFSKHHSNILVDYQGKGSGAGIKDFINHTVDFAASDAAMTVSKWLRSRKAYNCCP
jgi:phosphate transport system substrate-binding protein